jgi:hypothetical protein
MLALGLCAGCVLFVSSSVRADGTPPLRSGDALPAPADAVPLSAHDILGRALEKRFDMDARASIAVTVTSRGGQRDRKQAELASKRVNGLVQSFGRFTYPEELRGMAMLRLENADRMDDFFAYLPEFKRVRRLATPHRSDLFVGTDATYEDIERRRADDYEVELRPSEVVHDEDVWVVTTAPRYSESGYGRVDYLIAKSDYAILEQRHYRVGAEDAFKVIEAPRSHMRVVEDRIVPMRIIMSDHNHGTHTEVEILDLVVNPELPDSLFTTRALSREQRLPPLDED